MLVVFEETAGGPYHSPYTLDTNHVDQSIARLKSLLPLEKRGRLVVYANFGALHLSNIITIGGWVTDPTKSIKKAGSPHIQ